jgi:hypothetical protein
MRPIMSCVIPGRGVVEDSGLFTLVRYDRSMTCAGEPSGKRDSQHSENTASDRFQELESRLPRKLPHPLMGHHRFYPRFNVDAINELMHVLGQEWQERRYKHEIARYRLLVFSAAAGVVFAPGVMVLLVWHSSPMRGVPGSEKIIYTIVAVGLFWVAWQSRVGGARRRFFRRIGTALRSVEAALMQENMRWLRFQPLYEGSLVETFNAAGRAARALFSSLQRSRRTWHAPPTVAERAIRLSRPLIDIEIVDDLDVTHGGDFIPRILLHATVASSAW